MDRERKVSARAAGGAGEHRWEVVATVKVREGPAPRRAGAERDRQ